MCLDYDRMPTGAQESKRKTRNRLDSGAWPPPIAHNEFMSSESIAAQIQREVASWPGVTVQSTSHGMVFFHVGQREIGHLHGSQLADVPFPVRIREKLVAAGKADLHYIHPKSGWITYYIRGEGDVEAIVDLLRLNLDRPWLNRKSDPDEEKDYSIPELS